MNKTYAELKAEGRIFITVPVKVEFDRRLRIRAAELGSNKAEVARQAIKLFLDGDEATIALAEMRRLFGQNWQDEVAKFEKVAEKL